MTAQELVADIFSRQQEGVASNMRYVTVAQIDYLRGLIEQEDEFAQASGQPGAIRAGRGRSFTWLPAGRDKYVVTEGEGGRRNTITRLANLQPSSAGTLFG
ncbi:MAG TPA: hypothetical protein VKB88_13775 [Bryobacteraceae bacterium]|nr:hypothetical protein [Bryobacteraceae bacterium]